MGLNRFPRFQSVPEVPGNRFPFRFPRRVYSYAIPRTGTERPSRFFGVDRFLGTGTDSVRPAERMAIGRCLAVAPGCAVKRFWVLDGHGWLRTAPTRHIASQTGSRPKCGLRVLEVANAQQTP